MIITIIIGARHGKAPDARISAPPNLELLLI